MAHNKPADAISRLRPKSKAELRRVFIAIEYITKSKRQCFIEWDVQEYRLTIHTIRLQIRKKMLLLADPRFSIDPNGRINRNEV